MRHRIEHLRLLTKEEITQLKHFLQSALEHFSQYPSSYEENYLAHLSVIIDCYALVLLRTGYFSLEDSHLHLIKPYRRFKQQRELIPKFALSLAYIINSTAEKAGLIEHPWFYPHFARAVKHILSTKVTYLYGDVELAEKLLEKILNNKTE